MARADAIDRGDESRSVAWGALCIVALLAPYVVWLAFAYRYHFLDGVNLAFHEAGHLFLGFFGESAHFLGGTIGQLFFPVACAVHFLQRQRAFDACVMGIWGCESAMYAAEYIADAQAQALPLVGGHVHDWHWLLSRWGGLEHCEALGSVLHAGAAVGAFAFLVLAARLAVRPGASA